MQFSHYRLKGLEKQGHAHPHTAYYSCAYLHTLILNMYVQSNGLPHRNISELC